MMMKMAEVSLAVYYRSKDEKGGYYGGPTYYMEKGLGRDKGFKFWGVLAVIFGIGIFGNVFSMQNFTVAQSVNATFWHSHAGGRFSLCWSHLFGYCP